MKPLRVYGYTGYRDECPATPNGHHQTREIVAVRSRAEAARITGKTALFLKNYGCWTGNQEEIDTATAEPGVVFWRPLDNRYAPSWTKVDTTPKT